MKSLKKHKKMLFRNFKISGSRRELKKINNIRAKSSNKHDFSISDIYSNDSGSSLSSDSGWDKRRHPAEIK